MQLHPQSAVRVGERHEVHHAPVGGELGLARDHLDVGGVELGGDGLHVLRAADLPPHERDVLDVAGMHRQAVVVPVHLEEQVLGVTVVRDLLAEHVGHVFPPGVEIERGDPDVSELVDFPHSLCPH